MGKKQLMNLLLLGGAGFALYYILKMKREAEAAAIPEVALTDQGGSSLNLEIEPNNSGLVGR